MNTTAPIYCEIVCGLCSKHGAGTHYFSQPFREELQREVTKKGWKKIYMEDREHSEWLCKACQHNSPPRPDVLE